MERSELLAAAERIYATFTAGDMDAYRACFSDRIHWRVPGDNPVSGSYRGPAEYFGTMVERMAPLEAWRFEVLGMSTNEKDNAVLVRFHVAGSRKGRTVDLDGHHMIRLDDAGKITDGWGFTEDQASLDVFFS